LFDSGFIARRSKRRGWERQGGCVDVVGGLNQD
jgi:hypothetical protein